jgi:hypothetical protein
VLKQVNNLHFSGLIYVMIPFPGASFRQLITSLFLSLFLLSSATAHAINHAEFTQAATRHNHDVVAWLPLVVAAAGTTEEIMNEPESGTLVIPGEQGDQEEKKKCLKVCKKWGEDCMINPRTGARDCRKRCKEFGEECF